jgi:hypothetical protein
MSSLREWNEAYGDMEFFPEKAKGFDWKMNVAYPCKITRAKVLKSQKGDVQLELSIDIQAGEDEESATIGNERQWIDLPKQESDRDKTREIVEKLTQRRFQNLIRVYSAAMPGDYAPYKEMKTVAGNKIYIDFDDEKMEGSDFNERKAEVQARIVKTAEALHGQEGSEVELLEGTLMYIEKAPNPKNSKYPYVNYYATRPRSTPVYKHEDGDAPF